MNGTLEISLERERQVAVGGHSAEDDDGYTRQQLVRAARAYLEVLCTGLSGVPACWPNDWAKAAFKPGDFKVDRAARRKCLVKAGALIAAELDRDARERGLPVEPKQAELAGCDATPDYLFNGEQEAFKPSLEERVAAIERMLYTEKVEQPSPLPSSATAPPSQQKLDGKFHGDVYRNRDGKREEAWVCFVPRDSLLPRVLKYYLGMCEASQCDMQQIAGLKRLIARVEEWQQDHASEVHLPDAVLGECL